MQCLTYADFACNSGKCQKSNKLETTLTFAVFTSFRRHTHKITHKLTRLVIIKVPFKYSNTSLSPSLDFSSLHRLMVDTLESQLKNSLF